MVALVLFVAWSAVAATLFIYLSWLRKIRRLEKIPGPEPWPCIGNALDCIGGGSVLLKVLYEKMPMLYGEIFRFFIGSRAYVIISSPELLERVFNNSKLITKGDDYDLVSLWLGRGLLTSSGEKWKSRRRLLSPAFHFQILKTFFGTFNHQSSILCNRIQEVCRAKEKSEIMVERMMTLCTMDIICESVMGCQINAQTEESSYSKAVTWMGNFVVERSTKPWGEIDVLYNWTPLGTKYRRCLKTIHSFIQKVIKNRLENVPFSEANYEPGEFFKNQQSFLDLILKSTADGTSMNEKDISDEVNTFMFAGHDTTSMAMSWFLYCIASNQKCQEKLKDEMFQVFGDTDRPCTREDLSKLKYLTICIKETLRLYPTVPVITRLTTEEVQIDGYSIPAGCNVCVSIYALHRNPRIYPDPLVFNPDRFLPEQSVDRHPYAFIPFSAGLRNCIGQRFAMDEMKVVLSSLLRKFRFELSPTTPQPIPSSEITLKSSNGIKLLVSLHES